MNTMNGGKAQRTGLHVESPLIENLAMKKWSSGRSVYLKLDNVQPGGSFKVRGIGASCQRAKDDGYQGIVCPSGGNAGIAAAYSARRLDLKAIIVIFNITSEDVEQRIKQESAQVVRFGNSSDETIDRAKALASESVFKFIHPFDDETVWEGHSSIMDEIYGQLNGEQPSLIVTCCGGGGLFCGIMRGLERYDWQSTAVLVMETIGSRSFNEMHRNRCQPKSIKCNSLAKTLCSVIVCQEAADYCSNEKFKVFSELVSDEEAMKACLLLADQQRILVELACGTVMGALYTGIVSDILSSNEGLPNGPVILIICGGNDVCLESVKNWQAIVQQEPNGVVHP